MNKSFVFGVAVTDENFTGRKQESRRLRMDFEEGINTILISPRRWGKTSLVKHVCTQMKNDGSDVITVYLDIFGCKNEYEFYNALATAVCQQTASRRQLWWEEAKDFLARLSPRISVSPEPNAEFSVSLGITPQTHTPEQVLSLVEDIAIRKGKRIVVCIDEFQQIGEFADSKSVQARLRSVWQHQQMTSYCLFGSKRHLMSSIFLEKSMPFYQFGELFWLTKIPVEEWVPYIISHFEASGRNISEALAMRICETVDCFSAYVQQLAWHLLLRVEKGEQADENLLELAINDLLISNEMLFMQLVEPLSAYQMNLIRAIISGHHSKFNEKNVRARFDLGAPSNLVRLREALIERDIIYSEQKQLFVSDPVFAIWFRRKFM